MRRELVLISTVTAMPDRTWTGPPSISICVRSSTTRGVDQLLAVGFARFAFAVTGDDDGERLRGRDHPSDRMHHELLNDPVDWRSQHLQLGLAVGLDHVLGEARRLLFDFGQFVEWSNPDSWQLARR